VIELDLSSRPPSASTSIAGAIRVEGRLRRLLFDERAPSVYTATLGRLPARSYDLTLVLPAAPGGTVRLPVDVPYPAELVPTPGGLAVLGQLAVPTGGRVYDQSDPSAAFPGRARLRDWLSVAAGLLFLLSAAVRLPGWRGFSARR